MSETQLVFSACGVPGSVAEEFKEYRMGGEYEWVQVGEHEMPWYIPVGDHSLIETLDVAEQNNIPWNFVYNWTDSEGIVHEVYTARVGWCMLYQIGLAD